MAAAVDQFRELRFSDREAGGDPSDAAGLFVDIPDEFAAGAFSG